MFICIEIIKTGHITTLRIQWKKVKKDAYLLSLADLTCSSHISKMNFLTLFEKQKTIKKNKEKNTIQTSASCTWYEY